MMPFVLLLPLFASIIAIAFIDPKIMKYVKYVALAGSLMSLVLVYTISYGSYSITWFTIAKYTFTISSLITPVNLLLLLIVLLVAPIILLYSFGFMNTPSEQKRFYLEMLAFEAAMLLFSMAGDLITVFIAWEFLSLMSYLLIGFWNSRERANRAARKAITIVLMGDIALIAALILLFNSFNTFTITTIISAIASNPSSAYIPAMLLTIAILTKSAQFPFEEWLPDAMEGPTPVSAFLHSTTMVKAGVFAVVLLYPLFYATGTTSILLIFAVITAILSTLNAMKETHIKKVIAYSTIQELSLMIIAASSGAIIACMYFFLAQSFYKALLFFSSGVVMNGSKTEDLREASGLGKNRLALITTLFGVVSLAGFIPFSGFFAQMGLGSSISNVYIYIIISSIGLLTSFFIFRWFFLASRYTKDPAVELAYSSTPKSMLYSMIIVAALTLISSLLFFTLPPFLSGQSYYLSSYLKPGALSLNLSGSVMETVIAVAGAFISYMVYRYRKSLSPSIIYSIVYNSVAINLFYKYFAAFVYDLSEGIAAFDLYINEVFDVLGRETLSFSNSLRRLSAGSINIYVIGFSIGIIIAFIFVFLSGV